MLQRPARSCARHPDSSPAMASSLAGQIVTFYAVDMPAFTGRLRSAQEWPRAGRASACCSRTSPSSFSPPSRALSKAPSERWQGRTDGCDAAFVGRALRVANFLATRKPVHDRDSGTNFFRAGRPRSRSVQLIQIVYNYCRPGESTAATPAEPFSTAAVDKFVEKHASFAAKRLVAPVATRCPSKRQRSAAVMNSMHWRRVAALWACSRRRKTLRPRRRSRARRGNRDLSSSARGGR